ncbi:MAG: hypothetical protein KGL58_06075, partial [Pseudomonadota bacterium]|nr:hypothetical protein [Pseudomonadota bacterium]
MPKSGKLQNRYRKNSLIKGILDAISNNPPPSLKPWTGPFEIALRDRQNETIVSLLQQSGPALPKAMAFLQQLSESGQFSLMEKKYSVELFAAPVIFAAEIDNRGTISSRFATSDLGPLTEIFIDWFNPEAGQVILLDALPSSDEIEQQDYSGLLHLRENMTAALLAKKNTFPSPIPTAPIAHSGIPGENWHLRYIIGLLAQPAHENYQQLPAQAKPDEAKAKAWSKRLSIYLNMHIEATGTGFDVMPLLPNQVSYATEQAEAAFCLLQLEHFAIARAKKIYSN